jgi:probable rRNA maturation factor
MHVELFNRQRRHAIDVARLQKVAEEAFLVASNFAGPGSAALRELSALEVSLVSDRTIAGLHQRFLQVRGPTDVITFDHGEVIVSVTTAARQAESQAEPLERELARYIIHGFLHLNGYLDEVAADAAEMWRIQERVLASLWPER